jgi:hypothetical protein
MPITKVRSEADLMELFAESCFDYVPTLSNSLARAAAYYEYARESAELIEAVDELRQAGAFDPEGRKRPIKSELNHKLAWERDVYRMDALLMLVRCGEFPAKPFRDAVQNTDRPEHRFTLRVNGPGHLPWRELLWLRDHMTERGLGEIEFFELGHDACSTLHAISIPWTFTNDELIGFFRELIPRLRPPASPEPKKAGRRGRTSGSGAVDMLNQLGAFRITRAGVDSYAFVRKRTPYVSDKGWRKAVSAAKERIDNMTKRPFFG